MDGDSFRVDKSREVVRLLNKVNRKITRREIDLDHAGYVLILDKYDGVVGDLGVYEDES